MMMNQTMSDNENQQSEVYDPVRIYSLNLNALLLYIDLYMKIVVSICFKGMVMVFLAIVLKW